MCASKPAVEKFKRVCEDFPNLAILTKSATPGEIQLTFGHSAVGNKSLGKSVVAFALVGDLSSPSVISLKIEIAFAADSDKICLPITEVLLCAAAADLAQSKKQRYCTPRNAVLLPPFLTEAAILHGESEAGELLNIFACSIIEWAMDADSTSEADKANDYNSVITIDAEETKVKPGKANQASANTLVTIADDCDNILAFLQAVSVKYPRVIADPLSLRADKRARVWFQCWTDVNLPKPPKPAPQDHLGLTDVLTDVATRLYTAEALRPVVAAQRKVEKETKGLDRLLPTDQRVILATSATTGTSIPT